MSRLVIVSNRVPVPKAGRGAGGGAGGLAVALDDAIAGRDALWFGWSGRTSDDTAALPSITDVVRTRFATIDLTEREHRLYYAGFSNGTLWPLLHYRMGLAEFRREDWHGYRYVNERFAAGLAPMLAQDDTVWVHDFHLIPLGGMLRQLSVAHPVGFFLHVPFPPPALFNALPCADVLLRDLAAYDVVGVQTETDAAHLREAMRQAGHGSRVGCFPIGVDAEAFAGQAARVATAPLVKRLSDSLTGRALVLGVDRLDYSKGLPQRFRGFASLLQRFDRHRGRVTFLQVAPVSRGEVAQYRTLKRELDELAGRINGEYADIDWNPIRWITRAVPRQMLGGFHRLARVGLVTPLRDGMNLVAKEFVAAQDPADPGVLVLSRFAGAAAELKGAILVNPHDPEAIAEALDTALSMPREEALARWRTDWDVIRANSAAVWAGRFLAALAAARVDGAPAAP